MAECMEKIDLYPQDKLRVATIPETTENVVSVERSITLKRLKSKAKYISSKPQTFYSIAIKARKEWLNRGLPLKTLQIERAGETATCYFFEELIPIVYDYLLRHPEEILALEEKYQKRVKARKIFGIPKGKKVPDWLIEELEIYDKVKQILAPEDYVIYEYGLLIKDNYGKFISATDWYKNFKQDKENKYT